MDRPRVSFPAPARPRRPCGRDRCENSEACLQGRWRACDARARGLPSHSTTSKRLTSPDLQGTRPPPLSIFFERTADRIVRVLLRLGRVVTRGLLCRDFHMRVGRDHVVGDRYALDDFDTLAG